LTIDVPFMVVYRGGDALTICFNTVAILFMTGGPSHRVCMVQRGFPAAVLADARAGSRDQRSTTSAMPSR
jgi:hypothetical protein